MNAVIILLIIFYCLILAIIVLLMGGDVAKKDISIGGFNKDAEVSRHRVSMLALVTCFLAVCVLLFQTLQWVPK